MQQNPSWEAKSVSDSREIPCLLYNLKVHYHVHTSLSLDPTLSEMMMWNTSNAKNLAYTQFLSMMYCKMQCQNESQCLHLKMICYSATVCSEIMNKYDIWHIRLSSQAQNTKKFVKHWSKMCYLNENIQLIILPENLSIAQHWKCKSDQIKWI